MRRTPRSPERPHRNARLRPSLSALCGLALATGCAASPPAPGQPAPLPLAPGALRIRLVFGTGADLDLYVTDPLEETVYFANSPSSVTGGRLDDDRRCDAPAPRIETIEFASALPGRYRVGVDHAEACGRAEDAAFLVIVEAAGLYREERGEISLGRFLPRVLELELGDGSP
jgi:hypothetical protein